MSDALAQPELEQALERAKNVTQQIIDSSLTLPNNESAINEFNNIVNEWQELYKNADWKSLNAKMLIPAKQQESLDQLLKLQMDFLSQWFEQNQSLAENLSDEAVNVFTSTDVAKPEQSLASLIDRNLNSLKKVSDSMSLQAKLFTKYNSDLWDWYKNLITKH